MKTSEILDGAADVIQRDGWNCGGYAPDASEHGAPLAGLPVCAMGAIYEAAEIPVRWDASLGCWIGFKDRDEAEEAGVVLLDYLDLSETLGGVPTWNDAKDRTADEVIEALRAAAVIEAARESESAPTTSPTPAEVSL